MFENIKKFFKKVNQKEEKISSNSKDAAKERLHLVLMQDRANVSADFLELMKQEIIEVIKKYIDVDESAIDVRLTNKENEDGTNGAPALYANIPIINIKNDLKNKKVENKEDKKEDKIEEKKDEENNATIKDEEQEKEIIKEEEKQVVTEIKKEEKHNKKENKKNEDNEEAFIEEEQIESKEKVNLKN